MKKMDLHKALEKARKICSQQEQCSYDIMLKLTKWGITQDDKEKIISTLETEKFIDNSRYSKFFVRDKVRLNRWGRKKIEFALKGKNIPSTDIDSALEEIDEEEYIQILRTEIQRKREGLKAKNQFDLKGKLYRFAHGRGFETDLIYRIINECLQDN